MEQQQGIVVVLDALGAANYSDDEIAAFLRSRQTVLDGLTDESVTQRGLIDPNRIDSFTFGDTVLISYNAPLNPVRFEEVKGFGELLRRFQIKSIEQGILFRGAIAIGPFHVHSNSNTVMGKAVADAAAWYNRADWIGVIGTPHASLTIQSLIEQGQHDLDYAFVDYAVPLKGGAVQSLKAVNWPKAFSVKGLTPCTSGENARAKCLSLLTRQGIPLGTESKYFNTIAFFDECERRRRKAAAAKGAAALQTSVSG